MNSNVLEVSDLTVAVGDAGHEAVENIILRVRRGERVALVGESGSGKSVTANALTRLIEHKGGRILPGSQVRIMGEEVVGADRAHLRRIRAAKVGMVFQDPLMSLNPSKSIGYQIAESAMQADANMGSAAAKKVALELLKAVGIKTPGLSYEQFPHEFSGGMRQRVMIAIALACDPDLLIADEPTTALDVTIQKQILELLDSLVSERGLGVLLITHDMGVVAQYTDYVHVMYAGEVIEQGPTREVLDHPSHPYTAGLIRAVPTLDHPREVRLEGIPGSPPPIHARPAGCRFNPRCPFSDGDLCLVRKPELTPVETDSARSVSCHYPLTVGDGRLTAGQKDPSRERRFFTAAEGVPGESATPLLTAVNVNKSFGSGRMTYRAVRNVSLTIAAGETLGIVGESGSGKSTLARCLLQLEKMDSGSVSFGGAELTSLSGRALRQARRNVQMVFQDPFSSLDPRFPVGRSLEEPMRIHGLWGQPGYDRARLEYLTDRMALRPEDLVKYPREFSGGQLQRIAIMRALTLQPKLIALDEPVSSLDVSTQAEIISLLEVIQEETGIAYLFIAHDLAVVRHISDRIMVMRNGEVVESGMSDEVIHSPKEPYTRALLGAVPRVGV